LMRNKNDLRFGDLDEYAIVLRVKRTSVDNRRCVFLAT
jgi:hypothetical protein